MESGFIGAMAYRSGAKDETRALSLGEKKQARQNALDILNNFLDQLRSDNALSFENYEFLKDALVVIDRYRNDGQKDPNAVNQINKVDLTVESEQMWGSGARLSHRVSEIIERARGFKQ